MRVDFIPLRVLFFPAFMLCLTACAGTGEDAFLDPNPDATAAALFEEANNAMLNKDYVSSVKIFTRLKEDYPFSPHTIEAELSLADSLYLDREWLQASDAYKEFESMHPRHEAMPYVLYQIGMSGLQTYTSVDRPPTLVVEAMSYFTRLRDSFAGHEYAQKSVEQIRVCRRILAEYEVYLGDFFFRSEHYQAAWRRYSGMARQYPEFEDLRLYVEEKRHAAYFLYLKNNAEAQRRAREGSWHNWFNWL